MTSGQARQILLLYRPGFPDPDDDSFKEALAQTQIDPELAQWFEAHCAAQKALASAFRNIETAQGLKEQILSERKAYFSRKTRRALVAVSSAMIILAATFTLIARRPSRTMPADTFASFRDKMTGAVQRQYPRMDLETNDLPTLTRYLAEHKGHGGITVPAQLGQALPTGCAIFPWHGKTVSMICFKSQPAKGSASPDLFLFVIDRSAVKAGPDNSQPKFIRSKGLPTANWSTGEKIYLLGALGNEAFLKKYL